MSRRLTVPGMFLVVMALNAGCPRWDDGPPVRPPTPTGCFTTPGPIGCCGPLAAAANELEGIKTYGCADGRQRVYQAKFICANDAATADSMCKSGQYTAVVAGRSMAPSSCGNGSALFDIDDPSCPATW